MGYAHSLERSLIQKSDNTINPWQIAGLRTIVAEKRRPRQLL